MNQDEIIEMARKVYGECDWHESALVHLVAFAKLVAEREREACNVICKDAYEWAENILKKDGSDPHYAGRMRMAQDIGHAIRARGQA